MTKDFEKAQRNQPNHPAFIAYAVSEDGAFWTKVGAAWSHGDEKGFTLDLELLPAKSGRIVLRNYIPKRAGA